MWGSLVLHRTLPSFIYIYLFIYLLFFYTFYACYSLVIESTRCFFQSTTSPDILSSHLFHLRAMSGPGDFDHLSGTTVDFDDGQSWLLDKKIDEHYLT